MPSRASNSEDRVRTAEVVAALSLATDLGGGVPLEHGLHSTLLAMRLCERMGVEPEVAAQAYYGCLLYYIGCTANATLATEIFGEDDALTRYAGQARFGSPSQRVRGMLRAVAPPGGAPWVRAVQLARGVPRLASAFTDVVAADCEVGQMLSSRLGLPAAVSALFAHSNERWDGKGHPRGARREEIPLAVRIVHVAQDAIYQRELGGAELAASVVRDRGGGAFDPDIAAGLADNAQLLAIDADGSAWEETLAREPGPELMLVGEAIVLNRSAFLAALARIATLHHERLDGSGYHRGTAGASLALPARLLAAADVYHAMTEPRPHRAALSPEQAAETLSQQARSGLLDPDAVSAVLAAAGHRVARVERPAGLTNREAEVVGLLARGLQTKQVGRALGISVKTADTHVQNAYRKIGVSTRAGATLFAMEHGLVASGELPIGSTGDRS